MIPEISAVAGSSSLRPTPVPGADAAAKAPAAGEASFDKLVAQALGSLQALQGQADAAALDFVAGGATELHDVLIAMEKASLGLQLTMQVRNKVVEAYQEIMRMQV